MCAPPSGICNSHMIPHLLDRQHRRSVSSDATAFVSVAEQAVSGSAPSFVGRVTGMSKNGTDWIPARMEDQMTSTLVIWADYLTRHLVIWLAFSLPSFPRRREPTLSASYVSPLYCRTFWAFHMRAGQVLIRSARVSSAVRRAGSMTPRSLMPFRN